MGQIMVRPNQDVQAHCLGSTATCQDAEGCVRSFLLSSENVERVPGQSQWERSRVTLEGASSLGGISCSCQVKR